MIIGWIREGILLAGGPDSPFDFTPHLITLMCSPSYLWSLLVLAVLAAAGPARAADNRRSLPDEFRGGGLSVSMTLSHYKVLQAVPPPATEAGNAARGKNKKGSDLDEAPSIVVSACVTNASRAPVDFEFREQGSPETHWYFNLLDDQDRVVWFSGLSLVEPIVPTRAALKTGGKWRRTLRIPLTIDGVPLAPGIYRVEATLLADKKPGASAIFEVIGRERLLEGDTGIRLHFSRTTSLPNPITGISQTEPIVGARVLIEEIPASVPRGKRRPFSATGYTNEHGRFSVPTRPGHFRLSWARPEIEIPDPLIPPVKLTVTAGRYSERFIVLLEEAE